MARLKDRYQQEILPRMREKFRYENNLQVPRLEKIVINVGLGEAVAEPKFLDSALEELAAITGQRPAVTRAKKSVAAFKIKAGMSIGCKVTLRGRRMYEFFDRLVNVALPRVRDFRGISPHSFDGDGNFTLGIKEQLIFPEISYEKVPMVHGMDITLVTTAKSNEEARQLLHLLGMPFREFQEGP
ncbi:50S ribosomal protein L5 [candidate division NPL-UPA2 bacterium]|nr:50S ribosomal protein L5 [candidate division NPL-UPA2 bacterium]